MEWLLPHIDPERCRGHGRCAANCPTGALCLRDALPVFVRPERCAYCGRCEELCPEGAIKLSYEIE